MRMSAEDITQDPRLRRILAAQPYPLVFATISGAHLYGFASPDSDVDLRGTHLLPLERVVGLEIREETLEVSRVIEQLEIDIVSHDVAKFVRLLLKKNGYVLEQLYSPLVVHTTAEHAELRNIARACITRNHAHHYLGFAETQWELAQKSSPPTVKSLLYVYRVLLTGIRLMRSGEVEASLPALNEEARLSHVTDLVDAKMCGTEQATLHYTDLRFHESEYQRLRAELLAAREVSHLPDLPSDQTRTALEAWLVRLRLGDRGWTPIEVPGSPFTPRRQDLGDEQSPLATGHRAGPSGNLE